MTRLALPLLLIAPIAGCLDAGPDDASVNVDAPVTPANPADPTDLTDPPVGRNALCGSVQVAPTDALMVVSDVNAAVLVHADGSTTTLDEADDAADARSIQVLHSAGHVATLRTWGAWSAPDGGFVIKLHDRAGALLWEQRSDGMAAGMERLGDDGSVILSRRPRDSYESERLVRQLDGTETLLPHDLSIIAGAGAHGFIPVRSAATAGWFDPTTAVYTPVAQDTRDAHIVDGALLVLGTSDVEGPLLTLSTPTTIQSRRLIEAADLDGLRIAHREPSQGWLLLAGYVDAERTQHGFVRVDPGDLSAVRFDDTAPAALWPMDDCYSASGALDASGRLVRVFRDDRHAQVYRRSHDGVWTAIGLPLSDVVWVTPQVFGDTVTVTAYGQNQTYCPPTVFDTASLPSDVQVGASVQLISPDGAGHLVASDPWHWGIPALRTDGRCAALPVTVDDPEAGGPLTFEVFDVASGERAPLEVSGTPTFLSDAP